MGRRRGKGGITAPGQSKQSSRSFFFGGPSSCENSILPPYVAVKHIHHELGLPKAPYYSNSLLSPSFPLQVCTEAAIKHQHQQPKEAKTWLVLCAIYKSLDVSYFRLSNRHTHTCAHSHRHTNTAIYCAYGQAEHIRHIKLEDAIKRVKSIASACVCVCVCDSFLCMCGTHTLHTHM